MLTTLPTDQFIIFLQQKGIHLALNAQQQLHYKAKRGALTTDLQAELKQRKPELIHFLQQTQAKSNALPQIIADPDKRHEPFPLTDIQEAYWLGRSETFELHTSTHFYEEFVGDNLNPQRLEQAWNKLLKHHDMLRAIILPSGQQKVLDQVKPVPITCYDLCDADETTIKEHLNSLRHKLLVTPFIPEQWPLFHICFTQLPAQKVRIHFSVDMLIVDWGSYTILMREWAALYYQPEQPLPDINITFRDYVLAEKKLHTLDVYQQAEVYWKQRLSDIPPAPELPLAIEPAQLSQPEFKRHKGELSAETWRKLKNIATTNNLTPPGILLTLFAEILTRWSKTPRFTINLTLFNRMPLADSAELHRIVGDFTSLTLLTIDNHAPDETLIERGQRLQNQLWRDLEHRSFSGVRVLREINAQQKEITRMPVVFTSGLGISDESDDSNTPLTTLGESVNGFSQTPQVWLDCQVEEHQGRLWVIWDVVEALFPDGMINAMFTAFLDVLERLARDEQLWHASEIAGLELLPVAQQKQRAEVNNTQAPISEDILHAPFIRQAKSYPDRLAIISETRRISYGQLYLEAAHVAHWLHENGAAPNQLVPVVMEKGWEQIVAVLGILLSGAAYVPIDADLPTERQVSLLEQSEAKLVLTQPHLEAQLSWPSGIQYYSVTPLHNKNKVSLPWEPDAPLQNPTDLAYLIYTSGSTGQPKGVMISHRSVMNTVMDINQRFQITHKDRVLALSALNFDLSVYDIFGLLAVGGALVIPQPKGRRDPSYWKDLMTQHCVTVWNTVPALMQMLVEYQCGKTLPVPLRTVMMSGDWIPLDLPDQIRAVFPHAEPISLGGATEASIWSIYYPIKQVDPAWKSIPYGVPLRNQFFQVFNERLEPCPVWVPGQLCIGGAGLATGYWCDAEKTQQKFFTHPRTGEHFYDTGDLGRYLPDGNIEFLGREDFQVKIRGYRIELGEIESHLLKHPEVNKCVVSVIGENRHDQQIVAYVVPVVPADTETEQQQTQTVDQATYAQQAMQGVLTDPTERLQFRLTNPGIRTFSKAGTTIILPPVEADDTRYLRRQSFREYLEDAVELPQLAQLLECLKARFFPEGILPKYRYGSAGGLYPVQTYVYVKPQRVKGLSSGTYYYQPHEHRLRLLSETACMTRNNYDGINQVIYDQAAFVIFLVAEYQAIQPMYGQSARDFCLLEAGYISQLLMMEAADYGLGICPVGGLHFDPLREAFGLNESQEMIHSFLGGAISTEQTQRLTQVAPQATPLEVRLKGYLEKKLPSYMVPHIYITLDTLPLTVNGKVDRKALPQPDLESLGGHKSGDLVSLESATDLERRLLTLVKQTFDTEQLGLLDNFSDFHDSLDMVKLYNAVRLEFHREIAIPDIFNHPTVKALATRLEQVPILEDESEKKTSEIKTTNGTTDFSLTEELAPEEIDRLMANLENLDEAEVERLLSRLEQ